ncbi:MAG: YoaK family protein [Actinomycetota bacterium]
MARSPLLPIDHHFVTGLLLLTASTGTIDAVSYLALDKVFTGNMTGNVLFIGFSLVGAGKTPLLNNFIALLGFVLGSILGGRIIGRSTPRGLPRSSRAVLIGGAALMIALAIYWLVVRDLNYPALLTVTALLAVVMGAQVSAVKPIGNSDVTTIVVTNTLANLARDSRLAGGTGKNWFPRLAAVIAMGTGAVIGGLAVEWMGGAVALLAGTIIFTAGTITLVTADRRSG